MKQRGVTGSPPPPLLAPHPSPSRCTQSPALGRSAPTFAMRDVSGPVEVSAGVAWTGDAVVLAKLGLVGADGAADTPVRGGVVVVAGGAVHCGAGCAVGQGRSGAFSPGPPCPRGLSTEFNQGPSPLPSTSHRPPPVPEQADAPVPRSCPQRAGCTVGLWGLSSEPTSLLATPEANVLLAL